MGQTSINTAHKPTKTLWSALANDSAIKIWMADLERVVAQGKDWGLAGQAVVIEADDEEVVKELIQHVAEAAGIKLHQFAANGVLEEFPDWFDGLAAPEPSMVYLSAGGWQGAKFAELNPDAPPSTHDQDKCNEFIVALKEVIKTKLSLLPVVLVTTVKSFEQLNISLREAGMFDRRIQMPKLSDEAVFGVFAEELGIENLDQSITSQMNKVACLLRDCYPDSRRRKLMQKAIQRLAWREGRTLKYADLVKVACYGTGEVDIVFHDEVNSRRNAIHEAGHAVIGHVCSRHKTPASYCSIMPRDDMHGVVVPAYESHERKSDDLSYKDIVYKIKVALAGRAAEHLLMGIDEVGASGASSDMEKATQLASSMFGLWGLSDDNTSIESAGKNLATVIGDGTPSEVAHVEGMVRGFLQKLYVETMDTLKANSTYLDAVINALAAQHFLMQEDLQAIYEQSTNQARRAA